MKLSELIAEYGDDAVRFQKLDDCTTNLSMSKKGTKASFVTPETFGFEGFDKLGLIIWLDRERTEKIIADRKASAPSPAYRGDAADCPLCPGFSTPCGNSNCPQLRSSHKVPPAEAS